MRRGEMRKELLTKGTVMLNVERGIGMLVIHFTIMTFCGFFVGVLTGIICSSPTLLFHIAKFILPIFLTTIIAIVLTKVVHLIITKIVVDGIYFKHPRLYHIWSIFDVSMGLAASVTIAIARVVILIVGFTTYFCRFDTPMFPGVFKALDNGYWGYVCMHALEHLYQNPIVKVFEALLLKDRAHPESLPPQIRSVVAYMKELDGSTFTPKPSRPSPEAARRTKYANKWWLFYLLEKNPSLRWFRKHNLKNLQVPEGEDNPLFGVSGLLPFFNNGALLGGLMRPPV
eukprot:TRINITY_DN67679_c7_g1_i1.p1 TRINITY_DN67679_c7_g1~~TRINITY_DN67679_c7_g1_i1.p1  ORF type:complete len:332 (-),score=32.35 TRINITY_DN67679_c7_g1_i1:732-1586(-)